VGRPVVPTYTRALGRYVDELGLHDAVRVRGACSDTELADTLRASDVLVLTSEHEGFGVPAIEAMAAGVPVVANQAGALPDVIGDAGVLLDTADPYGTAHAVAGVLRDDELRRRLDAAAVVRLRALDLGTAAARTIDLLAAEFRSTSP